MWYWFQIVMIRLGFHVGWEYWVVWGFFFGQCSGPSKSKDPGPFSCCFKGLGLVHRS